MRISPRPASDEQVFPTFGQGMRTGFRYTLLAEQGTMRGRRHPEVRPPLRFGGGFEPDPACGSAAQFVRSAQKERPIMKIGLSFWRRHPDGASAYRNVRSRTMCPKTKAIRYRVPLSFLEAPPGIGPGIKVLQTSALPLGYGAVFSSERGREAPLFRNSNAKGGEVLAFETLVCA